MKPCGRLCLFYRLYGGTIRVLISDDGRKSNADILGGDMFDINKPTAHGLNVWQY